MSEPLIGTGEAGSIRGETHAKQDRIGAPIPARLHAAAACRHVARSITFNASPIGVAPLGEDRALVESALVSAEARSEGFTAPARALGLALDYFRDRQLTASRVVLLVSDGGATISSENRAKLTDLFAARHASLIWIYTRGEQEPSIRVPQEFASESLSMHEFFESLGSPYQMFKSRVRGSRTRGRRSRPPDQSSDAL